MTPANRNAELLGFEVGLGASLSVILARVVSRGEACLFASSGANAHPKAALSYRAGRANNSQIFGCE
jgi:hypothetical protein